MPTNKPRIQTIVDEITYRKFKEVCIIEQRTESQMAGIAIKKFIENYESQNGTINIKNLNMIDNKGTINM